LWKGAEADSGTGDYQNSINLEDGEKRTSLVLPMAKRYGRR